MEDWFGVSSIGQANIHFIGTNVLKRCDNTHGVTGIRAGGFDDGVEVKTCRASSWWGYEAKPGMS